MNRLSVLFPIFLALQAVYIGSAIDRAKLSPDATADLHIKHAFLTFGVLLIFAVALHVRRSRRVL